MPDPVAPRRGSAPTWASALAIGLATAVLAKRPLSRAPSGTAEMPSAGTHRRNDVPAAGKGRHADTPSELTARNWRDIAMRVFREISDDRVLAVAAGVTFYVLLAIFPAITAMVSLYGLVADPATITDQLNALNGILPGGALDILGDQVKRIAAKPHSSLGFGFALGLAVTLWSTNAGMKAMFDALNVVYEEKEKRGFIRLNAISLVCTLGALIVVLAALGAVVVVPVVLNIVGLGAGVETLINLARWPLLLVLIVLTLAVLYRFGPSRRRPRWRWVTWGSAIAAVAWIIGSMLFSWYVAKFGTYNETYGSLGAAIGFMTWIWISTTIVLIGAEINAEMEHETARDTTDGGRKPLGTRGARMADEVAAGS